MTKNETNSNQFEVLHHNDIEYSREGGYFVTTRKAIIYLVVTVSLSITVGYLVFQYGPNQNKEEVITKQENIQELLDKSIRNIPVQNIRLPQNVRPLHYKLMIQPYIENFTFSGKVSIIIRSTENTKYVVLNVDMLQLGDISLHQIQNVEGMVLQNGTPRESVPVEKIVKNNTDASMTETESKMQSVEETTVQDNTERNSDEKHASHRGSRTILDTIHILSREINKVNLQYKLHLSKQLNPQKTYMLEINFNGNLSESLQGLHENNYTNDQGDNKYIIASHFQPVFARRVFPCFDEPSMKASFEITIVRRRNMNSLSNMPLKITRDRQNGWTEDHFQITPPIPTYQVAMVLLDVDYYANISSRGNISIWTPKEHLIYANNPLDKAGEIMDYFNEYFNSTYALPKLDIVTIPTLPSTATENWGLIFFEESALLNDEDQREIFANLAKKLAQQWFGNLVSIDWWNDLWLVKGFALFVADEASVKINKLSSDFTLSVTQRMLAMDDFKSATSLQIKITNILQITQLFDAERHYKGSCLLRMLKNSIPEALFRKGMQNFIKQWKFGFISQNDFWKSINDIAGDYLPGELNVSDVMDTWSSQSGYPLITVTRDKKMNSVTIVQNKFQRMNESDNSLWIVPLNYIIENEEEKKLWLTNRSITVDNVSGDKWMLFNVRRTGYYRVNYDIDNWHRLIKILNENHEVIPNESRGQLINDAFKLAENGLLDYEIPFNLTKYLQKEENYMPWASTLDSLEFLKPIIQSTYLNGPYEEYIQNLVSNLYNKFQNNTTDHQRLRKLIIETACSVNYQPCIDWARGLFSKWMLDNIPVSYEMRQTIFCSAIRTGDKDEWEFLWNQIILQKTNTDIQDIFMSLGCTRDTWLINKYMRNALSGTIPWQYVPYVWQSLSQPTSLAFGFRYLRENWDTIYHAYSNKPIILKAIVQDFLYVLSSKSDLEDLTLLVSKHGKDLQELANLIQGAVDRIKARVEWSHKYLYQIEQLLSY